MGKVRTSFIKNAAKRLLEIYGDEFTVEFEHNKKLVQDKTNVESKTVRNQIAGQIARMAKIRNRKRRLVSDEETEIRESSEEKQEES